MKKIEINETLLTCIIALVIVSLFIFSIQKNDDSFGFKCPNDFETPEKYIESVGQWANNYLIKYPGATKEEILLARNNLFEENQCEKENFGIFAEKSDIDTKYNDGMNSGEIMEAIKHVESRRPPGIGESPDEEEIYNNPYIKHIRTSLNNYLLGETNNGIEKYTLNSPGQEDINCGLDNFDKSYYKSKFIVYGVGNNDYGGVVANIVFVDKPDTIFWTWVYNIGGDNNKEEYTLRGFCKNRPIDNYKEEFIDIIKEIIEESNFSL